MLTILILIQFGLFSFIKPQSLNETLSHLSSDAGNAYVKPVISAFGSNMNSAWVSGIPSASLAGFHAQIRIVGVGSFFTNDNRTFSTTGLFHYTSDQVDGILLASDITPENNVNFNQIKNALLEREWEVTFSGPTITGNENEHLKVSFPGTTIQGETIGQATTELEEVTGYLNDLSFLPSPAIQVNIGNVAGTQASFRYFTGVNILDLGKINLFGVGLLHNLGFWFKNPLPVDFGIGAFYQKLEVGDVFDNNSIQIGTYLSKTFGLIVTFTPYAGVTYESSNSTIQYTYSFDTPIGRQNTNISFDLDGENNVGFTIGGTLSFPVVSVTADIKIVKTSTVTCGVAFGF
jgi:hypothetical protein